MRTALTIILTLLLFACSSDDEQTRSNDGVDYYTVHIVLSTGGNGITRVTPDHNNSIVNADETGTPAENYINPNDVTLLVYDTDGKFVERAILHKVTPNGEGTGIYDVEGVLWKIPLQYKDKTEQNFQLIALCNINGMLKSNFSTMAESDYDTLDELVANLTFDYDASFTHTLLSQANETDDSKRTARIPMFGGKIANLIPPSGSNTVTPTIKIDVLRALAKIEVSYDMPEDNPLYGDFFLYQVYMKNYMSKGKVASASPLDANGSTKYNSKSKTDFTTPATAGEIKTGSIPFSTVERKEKETDPDVLAGDYKIIANRTNRHILYVPEHNNMETGATGAYLTINMRTNSYGGSGTGGSVVGWPKDTKLYFANYSGTYVADKGNEWDILRNDIYRYSITGISESGTMNIVANVPWVVEESTLGWDLDPKVEYFKPRNDTDGTNGDTEAVWCFMLNPRYEDGNNGGHSALRNASSTASFVFKLTGPEGAVWKVHLSNTDFFKLSGGVWTARASDKEYAFDVVTKYPWTESEDPETGMPYAPEVFDRALTDWGKIWEVTGGPETDIYITVTTDGINEREVVINPPNHKDKNGNLAGHYKDGRRWPGTDTRVRMKQLRAKYGEGYYEWGDQYKQ